MEYAAAADVGQRSIISIRDKKISVVRKLYRSGKRQNKGDQLANFKQGNDYGGIAGWSDDGADITNEVEIPVILACMIWREM
jgi:hypothetical protein